MKPEEFRADAKRPLTGEEYLKACRTGVRFTSTASASKTSPPIRRFAMWAASIAQMYDALHKPPDMQDTLCWGTDTGSGRLYPQVLPRGEKRRRPAPAARRHRRVVAPELRLGRTPDYKAAFGCALGANPAFYGQFEQNARNWYTRIQETGLYFNHAIVNPPIDRHKPADEVKDVYIKLEKETDAGIIVSGAKVVATNSALTHYNMIGFWLRAGDGRKPGLRADVRRADGRRGREVDLRASYEMVAGATGSPYDYPLPAALTRTTPFW